MPAASGFAQAGERIGSFTGLADDEDERSGFDGRVAVAELAGVFDFDGDVGEVFDHVFAGERGVPAGAACIDEDSVHRAEFGCGHVEAAEVGGGFLLVESSAQCVLEGARLLEDLLEHVVGVSALLGLFRLEVQFADAVGGGSSISPLDLETVAEHGDDIVVIQVDDLLGVSDYRGRVAGEEVFLLAYADN